MRATLPSRRASERFEITCRGNAYTVTVGYMPRGNNPFGAGIHEIFIDAGKAGSDLKLTTHALAIVTSIALQYGAPRDVIRKALPRTEDGKAEEILGTLLDFLAEDDVQKAVVAAE